MNNTKEKLSFDYLRTSILDFTYYELHKMEQEIETLFPEDECSELREHYISLLNEFKEMFDTSLSEFYTEGSPTTYSNHWFQEAA